MCVITRMRTLRGWRRLLRWCFRVTRWRGGRLWSGWGMCVITRMRLSRVQRRLVPGFTLARRRRPRSHIVIVPVRLVRTRGREPPRVPPQRRTRVRRRRPRFRTVVVRVRLVGTRVAPARPARRLRRTRVRRRPLRLRSAVVRVRPVAIRGRLRRPGRRLPRLCVRRRRPRFRTVVVRVRLVGTRVAPARLGRRLRRLCVRRRRSTFSYSGRSGSTCRYTRSTSTTRTASGHPSGGFNCPTAPATYSYSRRVGSTCYYTRSGSTTRAATTSYTCPSAPASYSFSRRVGSTCYYTRSGSTISALLRRTRVPVGAVFLFVQSPGGVCYYLFDHYYLAVGFSPPVITRVRPLGRLPPRIRVRRRRFRFRLVAAAVRPVITRGLPAPPEQLVPTYAGPVPTGIGLTRPAPAAVTVKRLIGNAATILKANRVWRLTVSAPSKGLLPVMPTLTYAGPVPTGIGLTRPAPAVARVKRLIGDAATTRKAHRVWRLTVSAPSKGLLPDRPPPGRPGRVPTTTGPPPPPMVPHPNVSVPSPPPQPGLSSPERSGHAPPIGPSTPSTSPPRCGKQVTKTTTRPVVTETVWSCPTDRTIDRSTSPPRCGKQVTKTTTLTATTATNACPPTELPSSTTRHYWTSNCAPDHRPNPDQNTYAKQYVIRNVETGKNKIRVTSPTPFTLTWATLSATDTAGATTNINSTTGPVGNVIEWTPPGSTPDATVDYLIEISRTSTTTALLGYHTIQTSLLLETPTGLTANGYNRANPFAPALNIEWQQVPHARGYEIKYCEDTGNDCPDTVTTRQTYCLGTNCAGGNTSQITADTNGTITAKIAKNTTTHSALAIGQTYRIHIRAQDTQTGYQHHQSPWSHPVTTQTVDSAPPTPTGLQANGNSIGIGNDLIPTAAQVRITWTPSPTPSSQADYYRVRYKICANPPSCADGDYRELPNKITEQAYTITGLTVGQLHTVQMLAGNAAGESGWSNDQNTTRVLAYTTAEQPAVDGSVSVAGIPYRHDLSPLHYAYKLCTSNMSPTWISEVKQGFTKWTTAMRGFTTPDGRRITASVTEEDSSDDCLEEDTRRVSFQTLTQVQQYYSSVSLSTYAVVPRLNSTNVTEYAVFFVIGRTADTWAGGVNCSLRLEVTVHEIGHVLGLRHATINPAESVMKPRTSPDSKTNRVCSPQPMDVAAVKALYQSDTTP